MFNAPTLLTIKEVACFLRVHRATVSRLIGAGALPHLAIGSRKLVLEKDLLSFLENRRSLAANESPREG
jgi:excisionase family DNA binding protein